MKTDPNHPQSPEPDDLRLLSAYLDGELPPEQARRLKLRLELDGPLRAAAEELKNLDGLLALWPAPPLADVRCAVMARVHQDLARTAAPRAGRWRRWAPMAWAASWVLGGVLTGLTLWAGVNHRIDDQLAAENMAQDMSLSMIMTEDWTPPLTLESAPDLADASASLTDEDPQP